MCIIQVMGHSVTNQQGIYTTFTQACKLCTTRSVQFSAVRQKQCVWMSIKQTMCQKYQATPTGVVWFTYWPPIWTTPSIALKCSLNGTLKMIGVWGDANIQERLEGCRENCVDV